MGIFDFFKRKEETTQSGEAAVRQGIALSKKIEVGAREESRLRKCFIAFDVETTGLSPATDRIVELGAVLFQDGEVSKTFSSLVNPGIPIPASATSINHITNKMLSKAPTETEIYPQLVSFFGGAMCGEIIMCAHNARFDFSFLCSSLSRLGYDANIVYIDTLGFARKTLHGLENYKQCTLEKYFGLVNAASHRASSDAENCGKILLKLLDEAGASLEEERKKAEKARPNAQETEVCAYIQDVIARGGGNIDKLRFRKNSNGYVDACCLNTFLKFKFAKKGKYILVERGYPALTKYVTEPCTQSEGGADYVRVFFSSPFDLKPLSEYIYRTFSAALRSMEEYATYSYRAKQEVEDSLRSLYALTKEETSAILQGASERGYAPVTVSPEDTPRISREEVIINAVHSRVPLTEIRNINNSDMGFQMGFPYWERGENERRNGNLPQAIELFDKARYNGYALPALYTSYALAYRQLKDYENEIVVLDEGIRRMPSEAGVWCARREKAIKLLFAQQNSERNAENAKPTDADAPRRRGKAVFQMDDNGNTIKEFISVAAASEETGVNAKSIRDAAGGIQKTAGGYRWKYKE